MKNILQSILPSPVAVSATFFLPVIAAIYFITTHYTNQYVLTNELVYAEAQNNFLSNLLLSQSLIDGFNRLMDFVFWGIIGAIVVILIWAVSAVRVSLKNHYAQEEFTNFQVARSVWHGHFFTVLILRVSLVVVIVYTALLILGRALPRLSVDVAIAIDKFSSATLQQAVFTAVSVIGYQLLIIFCVKIFKHLQAD